MRKGLTVSDIANRVAREQGDVPSLIERLRYWTKNGLFLPLIHPDQRHPGTGRWRAYPETALYVAAVLDELADFGLPIQQLLFVIARLVSGLDVPNADAVLYMPNRRGFFGEDQVKLAALGHREATLRDRDLVTAAIETRKDVFLCLTKKSDGAGVSLLSPTPLPDGWSRCALVVNLTEVFQRLR